MAAGIRTSAGTADELWAVAGFGTADRHSRIEQVRDIDRAGMTAVHGPVVGAGTAFGPGMTAELGQQPDSGQRPAPAQRVGSG